MYEDINRDISNLKNKYKVFFFAGGETDDNKFNVFTGSFISLMKKILENDFVFIRGIYFKTPMRNVIWALNNAQKPIDKIKENKITSAGFNQIISNGFSTETQVLIISSSSGSVVAAQTACLLAEMNRRNKYFFKPFHLVLGASMVSPESDLFRKLIYYQNEGLIGTIIHDEIQDEGDSSFGVGGLTRGEAYRNAFGLMVPFLSSKYTGPSFLNSHPEKGHIHRRRSQTIQKAIDFINIILIKHNLGGNHYLSKAVAVVKEEKDKITR
jgi:hypothetical protein